ncbi:MAG: YraN family protein [Kiritimatiellia bacterium]
MIARLPVLKIISELIRPRFRAVTARQATGIWGEKSAEKYLKAHGYKIIGRRVRIGRRDEIDLVARQAGILVFVEVKTRAGENFGRPFAAVNRAKRMHTARAAVRYLKGLKFQPSAFRFDVVEVIGKLNDPSPVIRHIEQAFPLPGYYRVP